MKKSATLLAALAVAFAVHGATRMASEAFVTNRIAAAVDAIPSPDFTTNNNALVETIKETAPAPGNYPAVSNAAMNAVQQGSQNWLDAESKMGAIAASGDESFPWRFLGSAFFADELVWPGDGYNYHLVYDESAMHWITWYAPPGSEDMIDEETGRFLTQKDIAYLSDIPAQQDLSGYATTGAVATVSSKVETLERWAIGDETSLTVREAGTTNATLEIAYTNKTLYASANEHTNTLNAAKAYTDGKAVEIAAATDAALAGKANRAWGETTSGGAPSPEDTLVIEKKKVALTGGGNFSYLESSTGGYWVMSISLGSTWTLESLADAQNPDVPATATFRDADGNAVYTVTSTGSREVYAVSGEQYIKVATVDGNDVITLTYPVATSEHPTSQYIPALEMLKTGGDYAEATAANWPDYIQSTAWSGQSGQWVCTITMKGRPGRGFFRAKYTKEGTVYTNFTKPLGLSTVTIGKVTYTVTVETVNGKKLMVLTEN